MKLNKKLIAIIAIIAVIILIVAGVGVYLFIQSRNQLPMDQPIQNTFRNGRTNGANFANVRGKISSIADKTAVVDSDNNQGQRVVLLSDSTTYTKTVDATKDETLKTSQNIIVMGDKQTDGSINAKSIELLQLNNIRMGGNEGFQGNRPFQRNMNGGDNGGVMFGQRALNGTTFIGNIESIDGDKVKIKTFNGDELTINIQTDTTFKKQASGSISDIKEGVSVTVIGSTDTSGTITARNIMIQ